MKRTVDVILAHDVKHSLAGPLSAVLVVVKELIAEYGPDATLDIDRECEAYSDYWSAYARIYGKREETDAEYSKRIADEAKYAASVAAREKAEFERLSKKFGNQNGQT